MAPIGLLLGLLSLGGAVGCTSQQDALGYTEAAWQEEGWAYSDSLAVDFTVTDTTQPLQLRLRLELDERYAWRNLWLRFQLLTPADTQAPSRTELLLQTPEGQWYVEPDWRGRYTLEQVLGRNIRAEAAGPYRLRLKHYMRQDTLRGVRALQVWVEPWDSLAYPAPQAPEKRPDTADNPGPQWLREEFMEDHGLK